MARKKAAYYTLVSFLEKELKITEAEARVEADDVYTEWRKDESRDIIELFQSTSVTQIDTPPDPVEEPIEKESPEDISPKVFDECKFEGELVIPKPPSKEPEIEIEESRLKTACATESPRHKKLDWRQYLDNNPDLICLNKEMAKKWGVTDSESITKKKEREVLASLKDDKLKIVLLQFFKDIAHIEGFKSIDYEPLGPSNEFYCGAKCKIIWENGQTTSGMGDAHGYNTSSFTKYYTAAIAENRAFIRAVKAYFNISIVGADEIGETPKDDGLPPKTLTKDPSTPKLEVEAPVGPHVTLKRVVKEKLQISEFEVFLKYLRKQYAEAANSDGKIPSLIPEKDAADWKDYGSWESVPKSKVAELISKIKSLE